MILVILYGWELLVNNTSNMQWKQIEKIQKCLITYRFIIKSAVHYAILLSKTRVAPIEEIYME